MLENENERLREQLRVSMAECDEWRKRALSLELQLFETNNRLTDEASKNNLLEAEVDRLNETINGRDKENSELRLENSDLMGKLADVVELQSEVHNQ